MENSRKKRKKNRKPLFILFAFFAVFVLFIYFFSLSSKVEDAQAELASAYGKDNVKQVWEKYKSKLHDNKDFLLAIRTKLSALPLTDAEIKECISWLPAAPESLNIIVVPDLSNRIVDDINNPKQIDSDKAILANIWDTFYEKTKSKIDSKDRLIIDVTDDGQAKGEFRNFADSLIFDLSKSHKGRINKFYLDKKANAFQTYTDSLYKLAKNTPLGANYWDYFETSLSRHIQKSNIFNTYKNILIVISDGYLEAQTKEKTGRAYYTGTYEERKGLCESEGRNYKNYKKHIDPIDDCSIHFPDLEVLVVEVSTRKKGSKVEKDDPGTTCDYSILKRQWQNWFALLEIKNSNTDFFIRRSQDNQSTKETIKKFISSS